MSLTTVPTVSIRTVRAANGDVSRNGFVRDTYVGVRSIRPNVCSDNPSRSNACRIVPNHARTSVFNDSPLLMNSNQPDWIRIAHSATMFSRTVCNAHMKIACENGCAWIGNHHDGQIT